MDGIYGLLLLFGDLLLKIPIIVWLLAFIVMCIWFVKSDNPNGKIALIISLLFYYAVICYFEIASAFIDTLNIGYIIPILLMLAIPYIATIITLSIITKKH